MAKSGKISGNYDKNAPFLNNRLVFFAVMIRLQRSFKRELGILLKQEACKHVEMTATALINGISNSIELLTR